MGEEDTANTKASEEKEEKESDGFKASTLLAVVRRLGYIPYVLVCLGILIALYCGRLPKEDATPIKKFLTLFSATLFVSGIMWSLARLFHRLFSYRPARGLIDGLLCGVIAGFIGGQIGYGRHPMSQVPIYANGLSMNYFEPCYLRALLALIFTVPIAGLLGLGCDLIHTDRKIKWRRDLGITLLVGLVFLLLIGFGIFRYVPTMDGKGITFSDIWILFEVFLISFCALMAWSFAWPLRKFLARLTIVIVLMFCARLATAFLNTSDPAQSGIRLWERQYITEIGNNVGQQGHYDMAITVVCFCIWTIVLYVIFYRDNYLTKRLDVFIQKSK